MLLAFLLVCALFFVSYTPLLRAPLHASISLSLAGMAGINGKEFQVGVKDPYAFEVKADLRPYGAYAGGGEWTQVKVPFKVDYESLQSYAVAWCSRVAVVTVSRVRLLVALSCVLPARCVVRLHLSA